MDGYKNYRTGAYLLIGFAVLLLLAALLTDRWGSLHSLLLMLSTTTFIGGAFLFALGGDDPVRATVAGQFSLQGISTLGGIIRDRGGHGTAVFLPPKSEDGAVMQFIPTARSSGSYTGGADGSALCNGGSGILIEPLAGSMLEDLKRDNNLVLPTEYALLAGAVREVCEDLLSVADQVEVQREGDVVTVTLQNYRFFSGCISRREASPESCALCPCSVCSLIMCMMAEGLGCEVRLQQADLDEGERSVRMGISCSARDSAGVASGSPDL